MDADDTWQQHAADTITESYLLADPATVQTVTEGLGANGAPETYIQVTPGLITEDGEITDKETEQFIRDFMEAFAVFVTRVLTVLPRER